VRGEGWGHGVGMSQYGARELAIQGYGYAQILGFYYPDTTLQRVTTQAQRLRRSPRASGCATRARA
jgi:peptidoglycan hydrolase-like amidase